MILNTTFGSFRAALYITFSRAARRRWWLSYHALESVQGLGVSAEEHICKLSDEEITAIPAEFAQNIAARLRDAAEMGDVMLHI